MNELGYLLNYLLPETVTGLLTGLVVGNIVEYRDVKEQIEFLALSEGKESAKELCKNIKKSLKSPSDYVFHAGNMLAAAKMHKKYFLSV